MATNLEKEFSATKEETEIAKIVRMYNAEQFYVDGRFENIGQIDSKVNVPTKHFLSAAQSPFELIVVELLAFDRSPEQS